eukprot:Skav211822  [mRNA]  locus=scaffold305:595327:595626:+ [translate_table: standard]
MEVSHMACQVAHHLSPSGEHHAVLSLYGDLSHFGAEVTATPRSVVVTRGQHVARPPGPVREAAAASAPRVALVNSDAVIRRTLQGFLTQFQQELVLLIL